MAGRRMFAKTIVLSDAFLDMPMSARCLYYTLSMSADDDGFVNGVKSVIRQCGATEKDLNTLIDKRFILAFDSGVIVIKHWRINNYIQSDRYHQTVYADELSQLTLTPDGNYHLGSCIQGVDTECIQGMDTTCIQGMDTTCIQGMDTQVRLGKVSIGKVNKESKEKAHAFSPPSVEEVEIYVKEKGYHINCQNFVDFYEMKGWMVGKNKMKDWKAAVRTWEQRDKPIVKPESTYDKLMKEAGL